MADFTGLRPPAMISGAPHGMRRRLRRVLTLALGLVAGVVQAQDLHQDLPDLQTCLDIEADRYEWSRIIHRKRSLEAADFALWNVLGVEYCGNIAITLCDRSETPIACQQALITQQLALHDKVLASLPAPDSLADAGGEASLPWRLYPVAYDLALGTSAGPDCEGSEDPILTWCGAREANNRLQNAVLAWQVGRYLEIAPGAIAAGWARVPPPVRPRERPRERPSGRPER